MEKIYKLEINKVEQVIEETDQDIFDEEIWINKEMWKIPEVTYSYSDWWNNKINWKHINTTLFCNIWWLNLDELSYISDEEKVEKIKKTSNVVVERINEKIIKINTSIERLNKLETTNEAEIYQIEIFINSLIEKLNLFEYCLNWLNYEIEKAWVEINISKEDEKEIDKRQKELDDILFWWEIQKNPKEVIRCYEYIYSAYLRKKSELSEDEQKRYNYFLDKIRTKLPDSYNYTKYNNKPLVNLLKKFNEIKIPDREYILWFNLSAEALEKIWHIIEQDENAKSISDWPKWVQFPITDKFKSLTAKRFLELNTHEIETHNITDHNNKQINWNIRWAWSIIKDEWLAILMEKILQHWDQLFKVDEKSWKTIIDIEKLPIKISFVYILMSELLDNDELIEFLTLNEKIEKDTIEVLSRFLRLKRSNKNGTQHKDTSYIRWLFEVAEEINKYILSDWKEWIAIEDLFLWKIWIKEAHKLKAIKENKESKWQKLDISMPIFSSDAVIYIIEEIFKWESSDINHNSFLKYLNNKYPIYKFSKERITDVSIKTWSNIYWMANIIMKNKSNSDLDNINITNNRYKNTIKRILSNQFNVPIYRAFKNLDNTRQKASEFIKKK